MSDNPEFIGTWTLQEWSVTHLPSGQKHLPFDGHTAGHIIYTADGWVSATLMDTKRRPVEQERHRMIAAKTQLKSGQWPSAGSDDADLVRDYALAAMGYVGYTGQFSCTETQVSHHVRESNIPQWVGFSLVRDFSFEGDRLILTAQQEDFLDTLIWQR